MLGGRFRGKRKPLLVVVLIVLGMVGLYVSDARWTLKTFWLGSCGDRCLPRRVISEGQSLQLLSFTVPSYRFSVASTVARDKALPHIQAYSTQRQTKHKSLKKLQMIKSALAPSFISTRASFKLSALRRRRRHWCASGWKRSSSAYVTKDKR